MPTKKKTEDSPKVASTESRLVDDPPVVVGGGSSVNIIFKNTASPVTPPPGRKKFRLPNNITTLLIYDGINPDLIEVPVSGTFFVHFND